MRLKFYSATLPSPAHPKENQDAFFIDEGNYSAGVFDGVGGLSHGGEAASLAASCCRKELRLSSLERTLKTCHKSLKHKAKELQAEIATTAGVVKIYPRQTPSPVVWGSAGDSRIYHFSDEELVQKSVDDSLITQAWERGWLKPAAAEKINQATKLKGMNEVESNLFKGRNIITQALGIGEMKPRIGKFKVNPGDLILLTTDGVHDNLTNREIEEILKSNPKDPAKALVESAAEVAESTSLRSKPDDTTAVVVRIKKSTPGVESYRLLVD